jgi:hypothetical protein
MMRRLAEKVGWPLFALAVAFALWLTFMGSPELVASISVPIEYLNMPPDLETTTELPRRVSLEIRGPSARLHEADLSDRHVILNLESVQAPGERTFTIESSDVNLPVGLSLVRAIPAQIRLTFERSIAVSVPVRVRFAAPPPNGYRVASERVEPSELTVVGPESRVRLVGYVETDPLDLSHTVGTATFQVHAFVGEPQVRFVSSPQVRVSIALEKTVREGVASGGSETVRN